MRSMITKFVQNATIRIFPVLLVLGFVLFSCHREKPGSSLPNIIYILEGRSTPGKPQPYVITEDWPGLEWMKKR